jgi:hypothetical protein
MYNNPNMDSESPLPDTEDWQIVFEPYFAHPETALGLARRFAAIRQALKAKPQNVLEAIDSLDLAIEVLFEHTQFYSGAYELYQTMIEGRADRAHETLAENLGVKF